MEGSELEKFEIKDIKENIDLFIYYLSRLELEENNPNLIKGNKMLEIARGLSSERLENAELLKRLLIIERFLAEIYEEEQLKQKTEMQDVLDILEASYAFSSSGDDSEDDFEEDLWL